MNLSANCGGNIISGTLGSSCCSHVCSQSRLSSSPAVHRCKFSSNYFRGNLKMVRRASEMGTEFEGNDDDDESRKSNGEENDLLSSESISGSKSEPGVVSDITEGTSPESSVLQYESLGNDNGVKSDATEAKLEVLHFCVVQI